MTVNRGSHKTPGKSGSGCLVRMVRVWPSAFMDSIRAQRFASADLASVRSREDRTASAVTLLPLENFAPFLMVKVQVSLSSATCQRSASQGAACMVLSNFASVSPWPQRIRVWPAA